MYASHGFLRSDIGDVDVVYHDASIICSIWCCPITIHRARRQHGRHDMAPGQECTFVGEPGEWDDDMLWTMHVTPDPDRQGEWRMFYTGLARAEYGRVQRVGLARSKDLYTWERCNHGNYPPAGAGPALREHCRRRPEVGQFPRSVLLCRRRHRRTPAAGLCPCQGRPVIRRGCVGLARETNRTNSHSSHLFIGPVFMTTSRCRTCFVSMAAIT